MESIKFCEEAFSIFPVMKLLKSNEASYKLICDNWKLFGYSLGLHKDEIDGLRDMIAAGGMETQDIPREILRLWKDGHDEDANLKVLYDALIDVKAKDLAGAVREKFGGGPNDDAPPAAKRLRRMSSDTSGNESEETVIFSNDGGDLNIPDEYGDFPLLQAIRSCHAVRIQKLLDEGANPNVITNDTDRDNAAHEVISSLIDKLLDTKGALVILDLFVSKGFNLINEGDNRGITPLIYAMQCENLSEELLSWFFHNGADFNAVTSDNGSSPLFQAIRNQQGVEIIRKILEFGGNPKHVDKYNHNVLHKAALYAHESAMEILISKVDVKDANEKNNRTPLHYLFVKHELDYQHCLKLLLRKGCNFEAKCNKGYVPLVEWMKRGNPYPTLIQMKDELPVTEEIASATLTAILEGMGRLEKFMPPSSEEAQNEFVKFIVSLIEDKKAKLHFQDEEKWNQENWGKFDQFLLTRNFFKELRTTLRMKWDGGFIQIKAIYLGKIDFFTKSWGVTVPVETVIVCLLAAKEYKGLVELCKVLKGFL